MVNSYKILGQTAPPANISTTIYTVPPLTSTVLSTIAVCNRSTIGGNSSYNIAIIPSGGTLGNGNYIIFKRILGIRDSEFKTLGITLAAGDTVIIESDSVNLSFSIFGNEIS